MKVELREDAVVLKAENEFERQALQKLQQKGVSKISFEDAWERKGALVLEHRKHPWDER